MSQLVEFLVPATAMVAATALGTSYALVAATAGHANEPISGVMVPATARGLSWVSCYGTCSAIMVAATAMGTCYRVGTCYCDVTACEKFL